MKKILALTTINNTLSLKDAVEKIKKEHGELVKIRKVYLEEYEDPTISLEDIEKSIKQSDIILVDIRGDIRLARELPKLLDGKDKTVVVTVWGSPQILAMTKMGNFNGQEVIKTFQAHDMDLDHIIRYQKQDELPGKMDELLEDEVRQDMELWLQSLEYYGQNDSENLKNFILFLLKNFAGVEGLGEIPPAIEQPLYGLYLPYQGIYQDMEEYKRRIRFDDELPTVGVLFYGGMHFDDTRPLADALFEHLRGDANVLVVFSHVEKNITAINEYLKDIDLFVNLQYFQINGGPMGGSPEPTLKFFQKVDVPYLLSLRGYETDVHQWQSGEHDLSPLEIILGVTMPELDGAIEPLFTAGLETIQDPEMGRVKIIKVLPDRMEKQAQRIRKWLSLRKKENKDKKIAILTYNYPPGEENLAGSGYLDVFASMEIFLKQLQENGYHFDLPDEKLKDLFLKEGILNSPKYHQKTGIKIRKDEYISWFLKLPEDVQVMVKNHWGEPPGDIMVEGDRIILPGINLGNIFLGVQPSRGVHENPEDAYHDKELPPHHQYLAYYYYLEHVYGADALLHFGMHGTLEFTPGKQVGLSSSCFPDLLIGTLPHIYYYWVGNTSESTIAKRRSYAQCISHASPPMKSSGLYEDYLNLEELLNQYQENKDEKTLKIIEEMAEKLHLPLSADEISKELYRMKKRLIPHGLHVLDYKPNQEQLTDYLLGVLRIERQYPSILKLVAEAIEEDETEKTQQTRINESQLEDEAKIVIKSLIKENSLSKVSSRLEDTLEENASGKGEPQTKGNILPHLPDGYVEYVQGIIANIDGSQESQGLLKALEGRYITPCRGGDPIRDPDVYPTGRAMYAFDPRQIPTVAAESRGQMAAELLIKSYLEEHGTYPERVGIVLWGFETLKTGGDTIATILALLGMRIKHQKGAWFKNIEVIPLEELGRPRIDVTITICGIFRDTLATHIDFINRAVRRVTRLEESPEDNYPRKHYLEDSEKLGDLAMARIFGPAPTEYATSMRTRVENGNWEEEEELVENYQESMQYAYQEGTITESAEAFNRAISQVDLVTQERDNTEYEVTDLDHYYEFLGGLARTIESKRGEKADIMVVDSTEEEVRVEGLSQTIQRASRTRLLNPAWVDGMLNHEFHGAQKIQNSLEYLLGFAATTGQVENWLFDEAADKLLFDEKMRKRIQENNPYAAVKMGETLLETERRGYWEADEEKIKELRNLVVEMDAEVE
ncbi:MAG: magnesium chelatase subunit H [Methanobacteriaceae archaeon]|nr:magnesium chelatase subunit H [Methanobacteriaceae archaeon]